MMALSARETIPLKANFVIRNKSFLVKLTSSEICWEQISCATGGGEICKQLVGKTKKDNERETVKCSEIIAVKLGCDSESHVRGKFHHLEAIAHDSTIFSIWFVDRYSQHRWRHRHVSFQSRESCVAQQWVEEIQALLSRPELKRPRSLLVFINPIGGRKRGPNIYHKMAAPVFELAGVSCDVVMTQRRNHAKDVLLDYDLSKVDGVVSVGGDGMLSEVMHGLLTRSLRERGSSQPHPDEPLPSPSLRIGIIPAGSTDAVACSTNGTEDPVTATLHIILGDSIALDVGTVHHGNEFLGYNMSLLGYGYYGDCIAESEATRWMGPHRYDWLGFKKLLNHRVYNGEVSFLPSGNDASHPQDGTWCKVGCPVCLPTGTVEKADREQDHGDIHLLAGGDTGPACLTSSSVAMTTPSEWKVVRGRFLAVNSFLMSCRCRLSRSGPAPSAHLGDGCTDLVLIHQCSRAQFLQHLYRCTEKADQFDFPFVDVFRVKAFKFRPLAEECDITQDASSKGKQRLQSDVPRNSVWNCDGEVLDSPTLEFRVHKQAIQLFARGVEDMGGKDCRGCLGCIATPTEGNRG